MSDIPKSFEEWVAARYPGMLNDARWADQLHRLKMTWMAAIASLTPQAAPGSETDDFDEAGIRAARPDVSEGGEGEIEAEFRRGRPVAFDDESYVDLNVRWHKYADVIEYKHREAIAQRDEARQNMVKWADEARAWQAAALDVPKPESEEIERLRSSLAMMYDKWENGTACQEANEDGECIDGTNLGNAVKLSMAEEQEILNLIVAEPEPHEQACANCGKPYRAHLLHDHNKCGPNSEGAWFPKSIADVSRLRSLPSEPQDDFRKAVENEEV